MHLCTALADGQAQGRAVAGWVVGRAFPQALTSHLQTTRADGNMHRMAATAIESKIFTLLATRQHGATICPSEVARALSPGDGSWRDLMPQVRQVAHALAQGGRLTVTRGGAAVDALNPGGPVRLGLPPQKV